MRIRPGPTPARGCSRRLRPLAHGACKLAAWVRACAGCSHPWVAAVFFCSTFDRGLGREIVAAAVLPCRGLRSSARSRGRAMRCCCVPRRSYRNRASRSCRYPTPAFSLPLPPVASTPLSVRPMSQTACTLKGSSSTAACAACAYRALIAACVHARATTPGEHACRSARSALRLLPCIPRCAGPPIWASCRIG
jgi:hypothetical protein